MRLPLLSKKVADELKNEQNINVVSKSSGEKGVNYENSYKNLQYKDNVKAAIDEYSMMSHCQGNAKIGV